MAPKKSDPSATALGKKRKRTQSSVGSQDGDAEHESTDATKGGSRRKNCHGSDTVASKRGTESARKRGKKTLEPKPLTNPMEEQIDRQRERVVFIDDATRKPTMQLLRKTQGAEPMAHLWADFLSATQSARDRLGVNTVGTFLRQAEGDGIDFKSDEHLYPTFVTGRASSRSRDNFDAALEQAEGIGGTSTKSATASVGPKRELLNRACALRTKAAAMEKQAQKDEKAADQLKYNDDDDDDGLIEETAKATTGMAYIGDVLPLTRKDLDVFMKALSGHVQRTEKRLRDVIRLKMAADLKLCTDIRRFGKFEMQVWQMEALPSGLHRCQCARCAKTLPEIQARGNP